MPLECNCTRLGQVPFSPREALNQGLKSKVGLTKAAALRTLNIHGCAVVAPPEHAPLRAPVLLDLLTTLLSHSTVGFRHMESGRY